MGEHHVPLIPVGDCELAVQHVLVDADVDMISGDDGKPLLGMGRFREQNDLVLESFWNGTRVGVCSDDQDKLKMGMVRNRLCHP